MKMFFGLFVGLFLTTVTALARLGETPDQCQTRYGNSTGQKGPFTLYYKDHINVAVFFREGISVKEIFSPEAGTRFSEDQISELLTANAGASTWHAQSDNSSAYLIYHRNDGKARAELSIRAQQLTISDTANKAIAGKQPTSGF